MANEQYISHLEKQARKYIKILEEMFGPCDDKFIFRTIGQSTDGDPMTYFPNRFRLEGNCVVDIHISKYTWENCCYDQGTWQVAHECVHLLDPGKGGTANKLEEGLATWFQNEPRFHDDLVKNYIRREPTKSENYKQARKLVQACMPDLINAVNEIRSEGIRISKITNDKLAFHLPKIDRQIINQLCTNFL